MERVATLQAAIDDEKSDVSSARAPETSAVLESSVQKAASFAAIRYANVWEDPRVLRRALRVQPRSTVFSIAAAGDNALALLLDDPARVVALDFNPSQLALLALKVAAIRALPHAELLSFLGVRESADRWASWRRVRPLLDDDARAFWDAHEDALKSGVLRAGRFERYLGIFRRAILPLVQSRRTVDAFLASTSLDAQRALFHERWNSMRWRALFRVFFGKVLLGRLGRDPAFFEHVREKNIGNAFLLRAQRALCQIPIDDNFFVEAILTGGVSERHGLPPYLEEKNHATLRARLDRLEIVQGSLETYLSTAPEGTFDAFNLSDCFEWMSDDQAAALLRAIVKTSNPGATLCYWNLLVPRRRPASLAMLIDEERALAEELHAIDRCFFYGDVVVERVR